MKANIFISRFNSYTSNLRDVLDKTRYSPARNTAKIITFHPFVYASPIARRDRVMMGERFSRVLMAVADNNISE